MNERGIKRIGRRLLLQGAAGVVVGLPLLEAFAPKRAGAAPAGFRYAVFMRQGNGVQQGRYQMEPDRFWPTKLGALTTAGMTADGDQAVNVLADYAAKLLIVRGCQYSSVMVDAGCGHSQGGLLCLTASKADGKNIEKALALGESIDNRIVRELQGTGEEPLTLRSGVRSTYLDDVLSYRGPRDRRTAEGNPYNAYKALFGVPGGMASTDQQNALRRKSVNDFVRAEMSALLSNKKLSQQDTYRLQQHQQAIRDLEVTMACSLPSNLLDPLSQVTNDQSTSDDAVVTITHMQMDVIALALSCGKTHAATLQVGTGNDQTQYTINGAKYERYHHISHRIDSDGDTGTAIENADVKHHDIDKLFAGMFKYLLDRLSSYTTPTGTLLDDGASIWLNDLSNGPPHGLQNVPYVIAGSCAGFLKSGAYVDVGDVTNNKFVTHNQFLSTIGAAVGCKNAAGGPLDDFGDSSLTPGLLSAIQKA
ncbi:MAG TPA: DUF1552 domain-containing protein [Polyangiaceae bacterium]|nr:DUF1552 domain-containing protein [Polyangiaceae bacterium]